MAAPPVSRLNHPLKVSEISFPLEKASEELERRQRGRCTSGYVSYACHRNGAKIRTIAANLTNTIKPSNVTPMDMSRMWVGALLISFKHRRQASLSVIAIANGIQTPAAETREEGADKAHGCR